MIIPYDLDGLIYSSRPDNLFFGNKSYLYQWYCYGPRKGESKRMTTDEGCKVKMFICLLMWKSSRVGVETGKVVSEDSEVVNDAGWRWCRCRCRHRQRGGGDALGREPQSQTVLRIDVPSFRDATFSGSALARSQTFPSGDVQGPGPSQQGSGLEPCSRCADSVEYGSALRGQRSQPLALETEAAGSLGTIGRATSRSCRCGVPLCAYSTQGRWSLQEAGLAVVTQRSMPSSSWLALSGWLLVCG